MLTAAVLGPVELRRGGAHLQVLIWPALDAGVLVRADRTAESATARAAVGADDPGTAGYLLGALDADGERRTPVRKL